MQEFEKAGELRDQEVELKSKIDAIVNDKKAKDDAEADAAGDGGPVVNDTDIANIVAQWTGAFAPHYVPTCPLLNNSSSVHDRCFVFDLTLSLVAMFTLLARRKRAQEICIAALGATTGALWAVLCQDAALPARMDLWRRVPMC